MGEPPEMIRQQLEETKSQLSEKLESLELHVYETVRDTGSAVNATVEAMQETVETVTGAVNSAVSSVSHAFDIRRQIKHHPWLTLGGAVAGGYLAARLLSDSASRSVKVPVVDVAFIEPQPDSSISNSMRAVTMMPTKEVSSWGQLKLLALTLALGVVQEIACRNASRVLDYFNKSHDRVGSGHPPIPRERRRPLRRKQSFVAGPRRQIESARRNRSHNSLRTESRP